MTEINSKRLTIAFGQSVQNGQDIARIIQEKADDLAFIMGRLHGEPFVATVSHETPLVFIRWRDMGGGGARHDT